MYGERGTKSRERVREREKQKINITAASVPASQPLHEKTVVKLGN